MIHQLIFAAPRPGMTEAEFQQYWLNVHAVRYASRIPCIRQYLIDTRIPFGRETCEPRWGGAAEMWFASEEEQMESLQSKEYLEGARLDEPRWAAFWRTIVLDTEAHEIIPGPPPVRNPSWIKLMLLMKRKEGMPLREFRRCSLRRQANLMMDIPGLLRFIQCHARDVCYSIGEPVLDAVYQCWFDGTAALEAAFRSEEYSSARDSMLTIAEPRYMHQMVANEHWIIGPESR